MNLLCIVGNEHSRYTHLRRDKAAKNDLLKFGSQSGSHSLILNNMTSGHGYKTRYDYIELLVERRDDHWCLILNDPKHGETIEHDEKFETSAQAQDAAMPLARRHIYELHHDTLLARNTLSWIEY